MTVATRTMTDREVQRPYDTTIRYTISGPADGPTMVLVHGWACNRGDFEAVTSFLPDNYQVIAIDLAEHGESRSSRDDWSMQEFAHDVAAVLEAESIDSCVMVGHSLGGAVAVEVGRLLPETVTRIVALDALHYLFLFAGMDDAAAEALLQPFQDDFPAAVRTMVEAGSPPGFDESLKDAYAAKMGAVRPGGKGALAGLVAWDMDDALAGATQPITLFAVGAMVSQDAIDHLGRRMEIVPVDLGSHHFQVESPEGTAQLLAGVPMD
jgi:pimeloyl-ACP methyl ester carboxylesterase